MCIGTRISIWVLLTSLVLALCLGATGAAAQEPTSISGKITAAYAHQDSIVVGDVAGHNMVLATSEGKNVSTGDHSFMDGAQVVNLSYSDLTRGNGPNWGYVKFIKGADTLWAKWEGKVTTVVDSEGVPSTSIEGVFSYTKGTGELRNIKGKGAYKGTFTSMTEYSVDWQSNYFIPKE